MANKDNEKRRHLRTCFDPADMGHHMEVVIQEKEYRFKVIDVGQGGIGILVKQSQHQVLEVMTRGSCFSMGYVKPNGCLRVSVEIRHVTPIKEGPLKGGSCVGFSISIETG